MPTARICIIICIVTLLKWQSSSQEVPFTKGLNLTRWFQSDGVGNIQFSRYTKKDLEQIQSLGCDVIRLPINLHGMTAGPPQYTLDPLFLFFLDQVIDWSEELGIYLILDNHSFDPNDSTEPAIEDPLTKVWLQLARHYKDRSEFLIYEVFNEAHDIADDVWNQIQKRVIQAIRTVDSKHSIIVGGSNWNNYRNLEAIPDLGDENLIYTFHFYDPFLFTHQGATWVTPSMLPLEEIPFPYDPAIMPPLPSSLNGSWIAFNYAAYPNEGTEQRVKELIDIAVRFRDERDVPVYCGEFGVYIPNSPADDRTAWYKLVRTYLEENDIPWTTWDYHSGFGLFEEGGTDLFDHDLNLSLIEALGFEAPKQSVYVLQPDSIGFVIYDDFIGANLFEAGYGGIQDYYFSDETVYGDFSLHWKDTEQWQAIAMNVRPRKDLTTLVATKYALDLFVKSEQPGVSFDLRFFDSKVDEEDRPWRMRHPVDESMVSWDGSWQHLHIPLTNFTEHGAWDNAWFEPIGAFDWSDVDRFEIASEYGGINQLQVDQIVVTNMDTAKVQSTVSSISDDNRIKISYGPNPVTGLLSITASRHDNLAVAIHDPLGRIIDIRQLLQKTQVDLSGLTSGIYYLTIRYDNMVKTFPILKN
ncbi:MAG: cellulase family glycosylhydrolase [Saprospiraceae bacterium]|nr:cellulase family glycosylhydrolase [Saprospiraceae bacterium]